MADIETHKRQMENLRRHMQPEERRTVALEQIADNLHAIHAQLVTINRTVVNGQKR